ncbi:hypothetical protein MMC25_003626 [Agyrium rufum]|nr:hypothetical protein [Agyrium rufum]
MPAISEDRPITYGRGGAGNIAPKSTLSATIVSFSDQASLPADDLTTPTIKSDIYTTGRGGQGNMRHNDAKNPQLAHDAQDVDVILRREGSSDGNGLGTKVSVGRGGAANIVSLGTDGIGIRGGEKGAQALRVAEALEKGRAE